MIKIVTESFSSPSDDDIRLMNLNVIPAVCNIDGKSFPDESGEESALLDSISDAQEVFSASPTATEYYNAFTKILSDGDEILCITASSHVCASYNNAQVAAKAAGAVVCGNVQGKDKISVFDSLSVAGGELLCIAYAYKKISQGATLCEVTSSLSQFIKQLKVFFTTSKYDNSSFEKRVHRKDHFATSPILGKRPCFTIDCGNMIYLGNIKSGYTEVNKIAEEFDCPEEIIINYSADLDYIDNVHKLLSEAFPNTEIKRRVISVSLSLNLGLATLGISCNNSKTFNNT